MIMTREKLKYLDKNFIQRGWMNNYSRPSLLPKCCTLPHAQLLMHGILKHAKSHPIFHGASPSPAVFPPALRLNSM